MHDADLVPVAAPLPTAIQAFSRVMGEVQAIGKHEHNTEQGFQYRGFDTIVNVVGPLLREHGVVIVPTAEAIEVERYQSSRGKAMKNVTVRMRFTVYGPAGDSFTGCTYGEGSDVADKAVAKAQTVAYRVFLLQALTIPTDEPDPDSEHHPREEPDPDAEAARKELSKLLADIGVPHGNAMNLFIRKTGEDIRYTNRAPAIRSLIQWYRDGARRDDGQQAPEWTLP